MGWRPAGSNGRWHLLRIWGWGSGQAGKQKVQPNTRARAAERAQRPARRAGGRPHLRAVLLVRSSAPQITLTSSLVRVPPRPSAAPCKSTSALSWVRRNMTCRDCMHAGDARRWAGDGKGSRNQNEAKASAARPVRMQTSPTLWSAPNTRSRSFASGQLIWGCQTAARGVEMGSLAAASPRSHAQDRVCALCWAGACAAVRGVRMPCCCALTGDVSAIRARTSHDE